MTIGYMETYSPTHPSARVNGCVLTQRLVAESMIGRPLTTEEVVHHIDKDKTNNEPSNLLIFKTQRDHARYHGGVYGELIITDEISECTPLFGACQTCGCGFVKKSIKQHYCSSKCGNTSRRIVERPSTEVLLLLLKGSNYSAIGRMFGVSGNSVRKWLK